MFFVGEAVGHAGDIIGDDPGDFMARATFAQRLMLGRQGLGLLQEQGEQLMHDPLGRGGVSFGKRSCAMAFVVVSPDVLDAAAQESFTQRGARVGADHKAQDPTPGVYRALVRARRFQQGCTSSWYKACSGRGRSGFPGGFGGHG